MEADSREANDAELLEKAADGDARSFHVLIDRHSDRLFRLACSLVGRAADAEDVLQEAFAGAYRGLKRFEGRASVSTWLTRIVVTQASVWRRQNKRHKAGPLEAAEQEATGKDSARKGTAGNLAVSGSSGTVDARIDIHAALEKLSPTHRDVLVLREFEQMSYGEIAAVLGIPQGTVESRLYRAREELRQKLSAYLP